ncbi:MAG TPA: M56 family metallopeptidase [Gemmatimonadaceae bacterium]|nr:M56 family metallopeptidase [Gemmatimonadaceae bacterium]
MILGWMTYSVLIGGFAVFAAHALENAARVIGKPSRWIWFAALTGTLAMSMAALYEFVGMAVRFIPRRSDAQWLEGPASTYIRFYDSFSRWDIYLSPMLWIASALTAAVFAIAVWRLVQRRRAWHRASMDGHSVLVSEAEGPAIVGFVRSAIVVPKWALAESERVRSLIMAHELEHQRAGDHLLSAVALIATIAQPWNPAVWWIARRLRVALEVDCDSRVLRRGSDPRTYGLLLLEAGSRAAGCRMPVPALSRPLSSLEERLQIITAERRSGRTRAARLALVAVIVIATAAFVPEPGALHCMLQGLGFQVSITSSY